jgi:hypothetical protein
LSAGVVIPAAEARLAGSPTGGRVGAVSHRLLRFVSADTLELRIATGQAAVQISKQAAIRDALRDAPWRHASATGISLVRYVHRLHKVPAGTLAWLVSVKPQKPVYDGTKTDRGHAANYYVVVIRASDGVLLAALDGYSPAVTNGSGRGGWATGEFI